MELFYSKTLVNMFICFWEDMKRYIAVALFRENIFIGFEEGYIKEDGIQVESTGNYGNGMDVGGYISFILIALSYAGDKSHPLVETNTKEDIYLLS